MGIRVVAAPVTLTWNDFRPVPVLPDQSDEDAQTATTLDRLSGIRPVSTQGGFSLPDLTLKVHLDRAQTMVVRTASKTQDLLKHEQGHYDITVLTVRALAREFEQLRADSPSALAQQLDRIRQLHQDRADALEKKYDNDTNHGTNQRQQDNWNNEIDAAMRSSQVSTLKSLPL